MTVFRCRHFGRRIRREVHPILPSSVSSEPSGEDRVRQKHAPATTASPAAGLARQRPLEWFCLLNLTLCPGLAQIVLGQIAKGVAWLLLFLAPAALATLFFGQSLARMYRALQEGCAECAWTPVLGGAAASALALAVAALSAADAWRTGKALKAGRKPGRWEFFP